LWLMPRAAQEDHADIAMAIIAMRHAGAAGQANGAEPARKSRIDLSISQGGMGRRHVWILRAVSVNAALAAMVSIWRTHRPRRGRAGIFGARISM